MANEEHLEILKKGVEEWNRWREENHDLEPDLSGADLRDVKLDEVNLFEVNLSQAILSGASLFRANFFLAILHEADLRNADLYGADFYESDLYGANLSQAKLNEVNLGNTNLIRANLREARLYEANFIKTIVSGADFHESFFGLTTIADVDMRGARGLETVRHAGPSTIGVDTLYKSQGRIPEVFLRGAGVPEKFIEYIPSLVTGESIQFYSCFISYSTKDQEFAERLHADLQSKGVRCWFALEDVKGGRKLHEQIPDAIRLYDKLLLVLSENSMESEWVKTEIYHARQDEIRNNKRKLFPIGLVDFSTIRDWQAFDADVGKDMAREIREYYIPDFSNWKDHDEYKKAFDRLMRDLEAEELPRP
jgi:hypothetical protein